MRRLLRLLLWSAPFLLTCDDALAWGLYTHFYFAQLLVWAIPLADAHFRRALKRCPELLFAGACLPDVSLFGGHAGAPVLRTTHQWSVAHRLIANARNDEERALAIGYTSHLLTDIIAHNYFVPAHETLWLDTPMMTHAAAEWAMDAHIAPCLFARPGRILACHLDVLADYAARSFDCPHEASRRALVYLMRGERLLRRAGVPHLLYHGAGAIDRSLRRRFDYYARETTARLTQIDRIVAGDAPAWRPEVECPRTARELLSDRGPLELLHRLPLPADLFQPAAHAAQRV